MAMWAESKPQTLLKWTVTLPTFFPPKQPINPPITNLPIPPPNPPTNPTTSPPSSPFNDFIYTKIIQLSTRAGSPTLAKLAHSHILKTGFRPCMFLKKNLINMYCKFGEIGDARKVLGEMPKRDTTSLNMMVSGYAGLGMWDEAMGVFGEARRCGVGVDKFGYSSALSVCARMREVGVGMTVHGLVVVEGMSGKVFLVNSLIDMYSKCGRFDKAKVLFERCEEVDDVSWNSMIAGYVRVECHGEVLKLFVKMCQRGLDLSSYSLGNVLKSCSNLGNCLEFGRMIHGRIEKGGLNLDVVVATGLLDLYAKNNDLDDAFQVFRHVPDRNVVIYNAMINGFTHDDSLCAELGDEALALFFEMQKKGISPTVCTFSSMLKICNAVKAFDYGKKIHARIIKNDMQADEFITNGLIDLYCLSDSLDDALRCFDLSSNIDDVSWTSMITAYVRRGQYEKASTMFLEALESGIRPDEFMISSMLTACACMAAEKPGEQLQGYALKSGLWSFTAVKNAQVCMYAESGDIDSANLSFNEIKNPNLMSWSIIIRANARYGCANEALQLFDLMKSTEISPNEITFLGVLTACSHAGLVDEGLRYFDSMTRNYGITLNVKHYACITDMLSRAGRLAEAENFILTSKFIDEPVLWRALLSGCRVYKDGTFGARSAKRLMELEPEASSSYVLLHNIYADSGALKSATDVMDLMTNSGVRKEPGLSLIEVGKFVDCFDASDFSHSKSREEDLLNKISKMHHVSEGRVKHASGRRAQL
ncbi:Pentatricopeptide repeat-containing protein [Drosera capensis]